MSKYNSIRLIPPSAYLALLLVGCAADQPPPPTSAPALSGEQMLRESQGMAQLGSRWQQGKQMVERGQNLLREGQAKIDEGHRMIEEGQKVMHESEQGYKDIKQ